MKHRGYLYILVIATLIFGSIPAFAAPDIPHQFYGSVTVNGAPAKDGLVVSAVVEGRTYNSTTVNGTYGVSPGEPFFVENPNGTAIGKTIQFFVEGQSAAAATSVFSRGGYTQLNLAITVATPPVEPPVTPPSNPPGGGGGGGSGGGGGGGSGSSSGELKVSKTLIDIDETVTASAKCFWDNGCILKINGTEVKRFAKNLNWQDYNAAFDTSGTKVLSLYKVGTAGILIGTKTVSVKAAESATPSDTNAVAATDATTTGNTTPESFLCAGRNCDDGNACTVDVCQNNTTCNNIAMTDGTTCPGGSCANGQCINEKGDVIKSPVANQNNLPPSVPATGFASIIPAGIDGGTIALAIIALVIIIGAAFFILRGKKGK